MGRLYQGHDDKCNNNSSSSSSSLSDALLLATICIVDLPVDVHVKDGSVYSGIFHTASVQNDYGIVLKKARMTKMGKANSNILNGALIDTLVILSDDLVQIVAKGVLLRADGDAKNHVDKDSEALVDTRVPSEKPIGSALDTKGTKQIRSSEPKENGFAKDFITTTNGGKDHQGRKLQIKEVSTAAVKGRQCGRDGLQGEKKDVKGKLEFHVEESAMKVGGTSSSSDTDGASCGILPLPAKRAEQSFQQPKSADASSCVVSSNISTSTSLDVDVILESSHGSIAISSETAPHISQSNKSSKESRLNPGAKIFSPSFKNPTSAAPINIIQTVGGIGYTPNNSTAVPIPAAQPEVGLSPFGSHSSVPVKILPYSNLPVGTVGAATQFPQTIIGHVGSRTQPLRYAFQYPIQAGPGIVHSNSQSLVYVHPVSQELVPGVTALSSPFARPLPTPHQVQFPKHQGGAAGQAMQLCVTPPLMATAQQPPYVVPCHIPILQPPFSSDRCIQVPGSNSPLNAKFL